MASSEDVLDKASTNPRNGYVYDAGIQLIAFMHKSRFQRTVPYFWSRMDDRLDPEELQSPYYLSYSYLGLAVPTIDADLLAGERLYRPQTSVLLCTSLECRGGPRAPQKPGYGQREVGCRRLTSGALSVWVRVFRDARAPAA
jgi:hypothetical protein